MENDSLIKKADESKQQDKTPFPLLHKMPKMNSIRETINNSFFYSSQLVRALRLVNFAGRILLYGPQNLKGLEPVLRQ